MTHCPVLRKLVSKTLVESELDRLHSYQDTKPQHTIQSHDDGQQMPQLSLSPGCLVLTGLVRRGFIPKNHRLDLRRKIPGGGGILWQTATAVSVGCLQTANQAVVFFQEMGRSQDGGS